MKPTLSLVVKYFAVVAVSCFLAVVISQTVVSAGEVAPPANRASEASTPWTMPGPFRIATTLGTWRDAFRDRDVPVKVYYPVLSEARTTTMKFPVILFSHGLGGSREGGQRWAAQWASHGYVVVAMQHAGSDEALWKTAAPRDIAEKMKAGMTIDNLVLRIGDVRFVIDQILRRSAAGEDAFANADPVKLGMSGHSFGAQTTLAVIGQKSPINGAQSALDHRITAAIAFSPNARNKTNLPLQFGDITLPAFSITGSEDGSILGDGTRPEDRRKPFEYMPEGQKYLAVFDGGDHMVFGGHGFGPRRPETARDRQIQFGVMAGTLAFWNVYLKQDSAAREWLAEGGYKAILGAKDVFDYK